MNTDFAYIELCKKKISEEHNLNNGSLTQRDYDYLNKVIFEHTGIDLSTATLRRIWSNQHQSVPQINTLDALAQVLEYEGWHAFKKANPKEKKEDKAQSFLWVVVLSGIIFTFLGITFLMMDSFKSVIVSLSPETTSHEGVPATIGFNYTIEGVGDQEIKIQLSWNPYEQTVLDPQQHFYTGTYFYPDYHQAKLLLEDEILASAFVHITTPSWHGLIMKSGFDGDPIYVDPKDFLMPDRMIMSSEISEKYRLTELKEVFSVFTLSTKRLELINGDAFDMQATVKGLGTISDKICWQIDVVVKGESGSLRIPISNEGCYGLTTLKCSDTILSGKNFDLSALSTNPMFSTPISLSLKERKLFITVGANDIFSTSYTKDIGPLKVVKFIFMGYGEVTKFNLESEEVVFDDGLIW